MANSRLDHVLQDQSKTKGSLSTDQYGYRRPRNKTSDPDQVKSTSAHFQSIKDIIVNTGKHPVDK